MKGVNLTALSGTVRRRLLIFAGMVLIFAVFSWLAAANSALWAELPRLRLEAGRAQSMSASIRDTLGKQRKQWTAEGLAGALNAQARAQSLPLASQVTAQGVHTLGQALAPEQFVQWLSTVQHELQLAPTRALLETRPDNGPTRLDVRIDWALPGEAAR